jgi:hypothetical protein
MSLCSLQLLRQPNKPAKTGSLPFGLHTHLHACSMQDLVPKSDSSSKNVASITNVRRWIFVVMLIACACGFAISVEALAWWRVGDAEISTVRSRNCFGVVSNSKNEDAKRPPASTTCRTTGLSWVGADHLWGRAGVASYAGGLLSAFICVLTAAGFAARRKPSLLLKMTLVSSITSALAASYFVSKMPLTGASMQLGIAVFFASVLASLVVVALHFLLPTRSHVS